MTRPLAVVALLALPVAASAQYGSPLPSGPSVIVGPPVLDGRLLIGPPIGSGGTALFPVETPQPSRFSVGGGSMSGYPQVWAPSGAWGGVNYPWPVYPVFVEYPPVPGRFPVAVVRSGAVVPQIDLSGQSNATLVVQLPVAAEIWVRGKKVEGKPAAEWTLTSPALLVDESHTFELKGRWKADGKTFEASRSVVVTAGTRSRAIVLSGTEVKE